MTNTVVISDTAAADIAEQFDFIRRVRQQPLNAERWLRKLYAEVSKLEDFASYGRAPESELLDFDLRQKVFKSHRIIYSIDESKHQVTIHHVRHGARRGVGEPGDDD